MTKIYPRKRSAGNSEDGPVASTVSSKRRKLDNGDETPSEGLTQSSQSEEGKPREGLKKVLHGISFQVKLTMFILWRAAQLKIAECSITSEDTAGGEFDDIVFRYKHGDKWSALFLQVKHSASEQNADLTWKNFTSRTQNAPAAIGKYFRSFLNLTSQPADTPPELVLCTNVGVTSEVEELVVPYAFKPTLVGAIFEPLSAQVFKFDVNRFGEHHRAEILQHCKEHSDCVRLAKQLAKCIYTQKKIDLRHPLLKKYAYAIKHQFACDLLLHGRKSDKGAFRVNEAFLSESTASDFKKVFELEYRKLADGHEQDVWQDVRKKGILLPDQLSQTDFATTNGEPANLPSEIQFHEIEHFMNSFVLVCKTQCEETITGVIMEKFESFKDNFSSSNMQGIVENELAHGGLSTAIFDWIKAKSNQPMQSKDIDDFFKLFATKLHCLHCKGISDACVKKMERMGLEFDPATLEKSQLYKMFDPWKQSSQHVDGPTTRVLNCHPLIVWQVLKLLQHEYIFIDGNTFVIMQNTVMDVFLTMQFPLILVIDCKESPIAVNFHKLFQDQPYPDRRMVIVLQDNANTAETDDTFRFENLTQASKQMIYDRSKTEVLFGTRVNFEMMLSCEDTLAFVLEIISSRDASPMRQNLNDRPFERIATIYIQRKWHSCEDRREKTDGQFGMRRNANITYQASAQADETQRMCVIQLVEAMKNGRPTKMANYEAVREKRIIPPGATKFNTTKVHIFLNDAGQGKSFYMTWLARDLQLHHPSWWVIKINLIEYSAVFNELSKLYTQSLLDEQEVLRILFQLTYLAFYAPNINSRQEADTELERNRAKECAKCLVLSGGQVQLARLETVAPEQLALLRVFEQKMNSKEVVVLFDGFDEIAPHYNKMGLSLLSGLAQLGGVLKMYLTSRPYDLRKDFHAAMPGCRFYRLKKLWRDDKKKFVHRHLLHSFENYETFKPEVQNALIRLLTTLTDGLLGDLSCVPLFLAIALSTFVPLVVRHMDLESCTIAPRVLKECKSIFELLSMMETFVEKKLAIASTEKTGTTDTAAQISQTMLNAQAILRMNKVVHSLLAMYLILNEEDRAILLSEQERNDAVEYMRRVHDGSEKSGIVDGVVDNVPMFIHRSFAEYFAAYWLFNNRHREEVKQFIKRKLFEDDDRMEIRHFMDRMLCREHPLHMAVLDGSRVKVKNILEQDPAVALDTDDWERTPLHLSVMYFKNQLDSKEVLDALVQAQKSAPVQAGIDKQDTFMGRSAMDYAFALGKDDYVKHRLLENGVSVNTDTLLQRLLTGEPISTLCNAAVFEYELMNLTEWCLSRTKANALFERVVEKLVPLPLSELYSHIPRARLPNAMPKAMLLKMQRLGMERHTRRMFMLLEFCAVFDAASLLRNLVKRTNPRLSKYSQLIFNVAMEYCSVHILQYLIIECSYELPKRIEFTELVRLLMFCIQESAMGLFKYLFDKYCAWYNVDCLQENDLPAAAANGLSDDEEEWVDSCDWLNLPDVPDEFRQTDRGMDTGTESLLIEAIQLNNLKATVHLIQKARLVVTNAFIKSLFGNYKIGWHCERGVHFLLDKSRDLRGNDESSGRNLLHHAAQHGWYCLAKCLIEHYDFDCMQTNEREKSWNAFFYSVSGSKYDSLKILTLMMERCSFDCFEQTDAAGRNVFFYAVQNNPSIAQYILQHKCQQLAERTPEARATTLLQLMQATGLTDVKIQMCIDWLTKQPANGVCRDMFDALLQRH